MFAQYLAYYAIVLSEAVFCGHGNPDLFQISVQS